MQGYLNSCRAISRYWIFKIWVLVQLSECRGISTLVGPSQDIGSSRYRSWYNSVSAGISQLLYFECRGITTLVGPSQDIGSSRYGSWYNSVSPGYLNSCRAISRYWIFKIWVLVQLCECRGISTFAGPSQDTLLYEILQKPPKFVFTPKEVCP